jgi:thioesterase domain-containing protein
VTPLALEHYLHSHIPLSKAMQVKVLRVEVDDVTLEAPLAPNINHQATVFGGSASAVAILAGWSLVYVRLTAAQIRSQLVIQRNTLHYDHPITDSFTARAYLRDPSGWDGFSRTLARRNRARLTVCCDLESGGVRAGRMEADYVALRSG